MFKNDKTIGIDNHSKERIGVFVCHCGINISETVDVKKVVKEIQKHPLVVYSEDYDYMCSKPGQDLIADAIEEENLTAVVVSACSPSLHETTFRKVAEKAGLNRYKCEIANIREHVSWVHEDKEKATDKAIRVVRSAVEKVIRNEELTPLEVDLQRKALVVGAGIAGIQAALDIADAGFEVLLVERESTIGGNMAKLSAVFPTLDCASCILTPRMSEVAEHPNIRLLTYSEVEEVDGYVGNFHVKIRKKPRYVEPEVCTLCEECREVCPVTFPSKFDEGLILRRAIDIPFSQAVPSTYTIDEDRCLNPENMTPAVCSRCKDVCDPGAINFNQKPEIIEENVGVILVTTGYDLYDPEKLGEYGADQYPDVITSLQFERLLSPTGPTSGTVERPSDARIPDSVAFIHCAGSRDQNHNPYCSRICCMYSSKQALLFHNRYPDTEITNYYIDIRTGGRNYEEFIKRVQEEAGVNYIKGKVSKIYEEDGKVKIYGVDTIMDERIENTVDMAVLALSIVPSHGTEELADELGIPVDDYGFLKEEHPKLRPVESPTPGVFIAGVSAGPKDIQTSVSEAGGAASKALDLLTHEKTSHSPEVAYIDRDKCSGCGLCISTCPYEAISMVNGKASINEVACRGCGACASICPTNAIELSGATDEQIQEMIDAILT